MLRETRLNGALRSEHDRERENQDQAIIRLISAQTSDQRGIWQKVRKTGKKMDFIKKVESETILNAYAKSGHGAIDYKREHA